MLADHPVDVMLLATDLAVARSFYGGTLGLPVLLEDQQFLAFGCGGGSRLVVTKSATPAPPTRRPRPAGGWATSPPRSPSSGRAAPASKISPA
jgi:catechol 2,3-dioxygenase-like lactoylglutathione lyase family enzyme